MAAYKPLGESAIGRDSAANHRRRSMRLSVKDRSQRPPEVSVVHLQLLRLMYILERVIR
jgi:hypothetical protein